MHDATRATYLPMANLIRLDHACFVVKKALGSGLYLTGSCLTNPDYRDVDVRAHPDRPRVPERQRPGRRSRSRRRYSPR